MRCKLVDIPLRRTKLEPHPLIGLFAQHRPRGITPLFRCKRNTAVWRKTEVDERIRVLRTVLIGGEITGCSIPSCEQGSHYIKAVCEKTLLHRHFVHTEAVGKLVKLGKTHFSHGIARCGVPFEVFQSIGATCLGQAMDAVTREQILEPHNRGLLRCMQYQCQGNA